MTKLKHITEKNHHICERCGQAFVGRKDARYCSIACRSAACIERKEEGIGVMDPKKAIQTRQSAQNIFRGEIVRHPEIVQQAQEYEQSGQIGFAQPPSLSDLLAVAIVMAGFKLLENIPNRKKSRRK